MSYVCGKCGCAVRCHVCGEPLDLSEMERLRDKVAEMTRRINDILREDSNKKMPYKEIVEKLGDLPDPTDGG